MMSSLYPIVLNPTDKKNKKIGNIIKPLSLNQDFFSADELLFKCQTVRKKKNELPHILPALGHHWNLYPCPSFLRSVASC